MKTPRFFLTFLPFVFAAGCSDERPAASGEPAAVLGRAGGMVHLAGGTYTRGHDGGFDTPYGRKEFPEEQPARRTTVGPFWIDVTEVTNAQFAEFVAATGYVTFAERPLDVSSLPAEARAQLPPGEVRNGALVFLETPVEGDPNQPGAELQWWKWEPAASWRAPEGVGSTIEGKDEHPVVCVNHEDAAAYAAWAGKRLPTEAEWEFAARGGLERKVFTWGDELKPDGRWMANTWQGEFPSENTAEDGFTRSAPAGSFPPNGFGLHDMAGNVWEICADLFDPGHLGVCAAEDPQGPATWFDPDTGRHGTGAPRHVIKGGSFLCHVSYCMRYRPAARHSQAGDSPTNHTGFRCVKDG